MAYQLDPPFSRGLVLGALWSHPTEKTDPTLTGASSVGEEKQFTDVNPRTGAVLSNETVTCVALRNTTAAAVLPGAALTLRGYTGVVDEYLPAKGCPVGEVFWLVIRGPTQTPLGTRVSIVSNGTNTPRMITLKDGTEVPEDTTNAPEVRVAADDTP